jgi:hypothetical protein
MIIDFLAGAVGDLRSPIFFFLAKNSAFLWIMERGFLRVRDLRGCVALVARSKVRTGVPHTEKTRWWCSWPVV